MTDSQHIIYPYCVATTGSSRSYHAQPRRAEAGGATILSRHRTLAAAKRAARQYDSGRVHVYRLDVLCGVEYPSEIAG